MVFKMTLERELSYKDGDRSVRSNDVQVIVDVHGNTLNIRTNPRMSKEIDLGEKGKIVRTHNEQVSFDNLNEEQQAIVDAYYGLLRTLSEEAVVRAFNSDDILIGDFPDRKQTEAAQ
jgi:hypothetical protein